MLGKTLSRGLTFKLRRPAILVQAACKLPPSETRQETASLSEKESRPGSFPNYAHSNGQLLLNHDERAGTPATGRDSQTPGS